MSKWKNIYVVDGLYSKRTVEHQITKDILEESIENLFDRVWASVDRPVWDMLRNQGGKSIWQANGTML